MSTNTSPLTSDPVHFVQESARLAHDHISSLDEETLKVGGFSTPFQRHLMNNLCDGPGCDYLEVGLFRGATFCAAACKNMEGYFHGVENFSQDFSESGIKDDLIKNVETVTPKTGPIKIYVEDCWKFDEPSLLGKVDVFMYDAHHDYEYQARALPYYLKYMKDEFVWVVDDFSWPSVQQGTRDSLDLLQNKVNLLHEMVWQVTANDHPVYHNGVAVFVLKKK